VVYQVPCLLRCGTDEKVHCLLENCPLTIATSPSCMLRSPWSSPGIILECPSTTRRGMPSPGIATVSHSPC